METSLPELLAAVKDGLVLTPEVFGNLDFDEVLSARDDSPEFDKEWNRVYSALDKKFSDQDISPEVEQLIEEIRENSYAVAEQGTDGHELANSISDDFELFARSIVLEFFDPYLESMWEAYENAEIPSPDTLGEPE
ncbi:MAG: hypothetical protein ACI8UO_000308 [Verrucomicrobiales bacterium]|jgi:hypothetical protein